MGEKEIMEILLNILWFLLIPISVLFIAFIIHIKLLNQWETHRYDDDYEMILWGLLYWLTLPLFGLADVLVNASAVSVWFWELPNELTVTDRCKRHLRTVNFNFRLTRKQRLAIFIAKQLNHIAPGHV